MANDIAWLAGLLEGECSFEMSKNSKTTVIPRLRLAMLDLDIIERVAPVFNSKINTYKTPKGDKTMYRVTCAKRSVLEPLLKEIYVYLGNRRKQKVDIMLKYYTDKEYVS